MFHQQKPIIMKKIFLFLSMLLAIGLFSACSSDDAPKSLPQPEEDLGTPIKSVTNISGAVHLNQSLQKWEIISHIPNTIDCVDIYYPLNLSNDYKVEGLQVLFSGDVYKGDENATLGGEETYKIKLTKIKKE